MLAPDLTASVTLTVTDADTAQTLGSGDVPVLGTPRVLAIAEAATVAATARIGTRTKTETRRTAGALLRPAGRPGGPRPRR